MPEMPEVETIANDLIRAGIIGSQINEVDVFWPRSISQPDVTSFCHRLANQVMTGLQRRGKYLIFTLSSGDYLCVHLRMTGRLLLQSEPSESPYVRLLLMLSQKKCLEFHDTRKFGRWSLVKDLSSIVGKMGPEPLSPEWTLDQFRGQLKRHARAIKPLLLDQCFLAGLGNIYVDEALWEAKLHPLQPANRLTHEESHRLYQSVRKVLLRGIKAQGTTLGSGKSNYYRLDGTRGNHQTLLNVFRQTGRPCPRCNHIIERIIVAQRSTHICPKCQSVSRKKAENQKR